MVLCGFADSVKTFGIIRPEGRGVLQHILFRLSVCLISVYV